MKFKVNTTLRLKLDGEVNSIAPGKTIELDEKDKETTRLLGLGVIELVEENLDGETGEGGQAAAAKSDKKAK